MLFFSFISSGRSHLVPAAATQVIRNYDGTYMVCFNGHTYSDIAEVRVARLDNATVVDLPMAKQPQVLTEHTPAPGSTADFKGHSFDDIVADDL